MKSSTKFILVFLGLVLIGAGLANWYFTKPQTPAAAPEEISQPQTPPPAPAKKPDTHYPINPVTDAQTPAESLPSLAVSDTAMRNALANLIDEKTINQFFFPNEIIRRLVVSIDNLPRENVSAHLLPLKPAGGQFLVKGNDKTIYLDEANYSRYTPYVLLIQNLDSKKLVAMYKYFYPLFQQQYQELGYPDGYFNDRLIAVIDYMINFTERTGPIQLMQQHVLYQYFDPELESMSAGGKLLTRIGHDNTLKIKDKLREIRSELVK